MRTAVLRRSLQAAMIITFGGALAGCDLGKLIIDTLNALGRAQEKTVRISGEPYFMLTKGDPTDDAYAQNGYLCVVHYPGCGIGEDGEDTFFLAQQLPLTATVEEFLFEPVPPAGQPANYLGPDPSPGSFGTRLQPGATNGSVPIRIRWQNACSGPYGGKAAVYRVSMKVKIKGNLDLGEVPVDLNQSLSVPACRTDAPNGPVIDTSTPSGWFGSVRVCNAFDPNSMLHLKASYADGGSAINTTSMDESINIQFRLDTQGQWVADYRTKQIYQQGNWTITSVTIDGNYGALIGLPRSQTLPGGVGQPEFNFTGGECEPR